MSVDHIILGVISLTPCSGYDMKVEFEKGGAGMLSALSFGSIYPRLKYLEQEGLIEALPVSGDDRHSGKGESPNEGLKRNKKVYELTARGWLELAQWLEQQAAYPLPMHDELLLKMLFWGAAGMDRARLIEQLQTRSEETHDLMNYIDEWQKNGSSFVDEYGALVLSCIQSRLEVELSWIEKTIAQLKEAPQLPVQDPKWLAVLQKARRNKALGLSPEETIQPEGAMQPEEPMQLEKAVQADNNL
jgi:PadR family transcriptional regulator AphA